MPLLYALIALIAALLALMGSVHFLLVRQRGRLLFCLVGCACGVAAFCMAIHN